jgi:hypothetical protein
LREYDRETARDVSREFGTAGVVFQGDRSGGPHRDNNILVRFIKPAARTLGLPWVIAGSLGTPQATWLKMARPEDKIGQQNIAISLIDPKSADSE